MVSVENLAGLIVTCIEHKNAANQVFLVSDDDDLSTARLMSQLSISLGKRGRLWSIPVGFYQWLGAVSGRSTDIERLCGSLQVDISHTKLSLGWQPHVSVQTALAQTAEHYLSNR